MCPARELRADHPDRQAGCLTDYRLDYQVNCRADRRAAPALSATSGRRPESRDRL
jgi:hypothetical protein